jgi:hypothetical protein
MHAGANRNPKFSRRVHFQRGGGSMATGALMKPNWPPGPWLLAFVALRGPVPKPLAAAQERFPAPSPLARERWGDGVDDRPIGDFVRNRVSSISRDIDYRTDDEISAEVESFAQDLVEAHQGVLPDGYVLDVAESDRGIVVVDLHGIVASGRYEKNEFGRLLRDRESKLSA